MSRPKSKEWSEQENKELLEFMEEGRKKGLASEIFMRAIC
jgi:hypothetical protein